MASSRLSSTIFKLLLVVMLPIDIWAFKILMVPVLTNSHVVSMATIAKVLADRGHKITLFIGEGFPLNLLEFGNRTEISVVRFKADTDYDAMEKYLAKMTIELGGSVKLHLLARKVYVNYIFGPHCAAICVLLVCLSVMITNGKRQDQLGEPQTRLA